MARSLPSSLLRAGDAPADTPRRLDESVSLVRPLSAGRIQPLLNIALVAGGPAKMIAPANKNRLSLVVRGITEAGEWVLGGADGFHPTATAGIPLFGRELINIDVTDEVWALATVNGTLAVAEIVSPFSAP